MGEDQRKIILQQAKMFTELFISRFESQYNHMSDITQGEAKLKKPAIQTVAERTLNALCLDFPIPVGSLLGKAYDAHIKKVMKKTVKLFPHNIQNIRSQLCKFAFHVFRCYESLLANIGYDDDPNTNPAITNKYNKIIDVAIDKIFSYFKSNRSKINTNDKTSYTSHFMKAFFSATLNKLFPSETLSTVNNVGIVMIDITNNQLRHFKPEKIANIEHYRLLNDEEILNYKKSNYTEMCDKLNDILDIDYLEELNVDNNCKYCLKDYPIASFEKKYFSKKTSNTDCEDSYSFHPFDLPDGTNLYIKRKKPVDEVLKILKKDYIAVVYGLKGCGKTELAIDIGYHMIENHKVIWIDGTSHISTARSFKRLYEQTFEKEEQNKKKEKEEEEAMENIENIAAEIYAKYSKTPKILIINNVESKLFAKKILPKQRKCDKWNILITTSNKDWHLPDLPVTLIPLDMMEAEEAQQLFVKNINVLMEDLDVEYESPDNDNVVQVMNDIEELVNSIPKYPFVIINSSYFIFQKSKNKVNNDVKTNYYQAMSSEIRNFKEQFSKEQKSILTFSIDDDPTYGKSIYAMTKLMIDRLKAERDSTSDDNKKAVSQVALDVLNMMTYFEPHNIPFSMFKQYCYTRCVLSLQVNFFSDIIDLLENHLFMKRSTTFKNMEELVQMVNKKYYQEEYEKTNQLEECLRNALDCLVFYANEMKEDKGINNILAHIASVWKYACKYRNICKVYIVDKRDNEELKILPGTTFLHIIAQYCDVSVFEQIAANIKQHDLEILLSKENFSHRTPLHCAAEGGKLETVKLILNKRKDLIQIINNKTRTKKQWTPLHLAVKGGYKDIVEYLIDEKHNVQCYSNYGFTPVHLAALNGFDDILELLLINNGNVNDVTNYNFTPLHFACQKNQLECVKVLLENEADYKALTKYNKTPLHLAAFEGNDDIVQALLTSCSDDDKFDIDDFIKMKDRDGFTAVHWAAFKNYPSIVEMLLLLCKDSKVLDEVTTEGNTALHLSSKEGHLQVIEVLRKYKANVAIKNVNNETAVDLAKNDKVKKALKVSMSLLESFQNMFK